MWKRLSLLGLVLLLPGPTSARWIQDIVTIEHPAIGAVSFSHYQHLEDLGNNCVFCHNRVFHIDPRKNPAVSMSEMQQGKSCGACHNGQKAFSVGENCAGCHPTHEIRFDTAAGAAHFSHDLHRELYSCDDCHPDLFRPDRTRRQPVNMEQMAEGAACGACHDGDTAFSVEENCDSCHDMS